MNGKMNVSNAGPSFLDVGLSCTALLILRYQPNWLHSDCENGQKVYLYQTVTCLEIMGQICNYLLK